MIIDWFLWILLLCISIWMIFDLYPYMNVPMYIIHLPDNEERKELLLERFQKERIRLHFIEAIDTRNERWKLYTDYIDQVTIQDLMEFEKTLVRKNHRSITGGAVGCFLSHLRLYSYLLNHSSAKRFLILEDDVLPYESFHSTCIQLQSKFPPSVDILFLDYYNTGKVLPLEYREPFYYRPLQRFVLMHAFFITRKGIQKVLKHFSKITMQIDFYISQLIEQKVLTVWGIYPPICRQGVDGPSNIQMGTVKEKSNWSLYD